MDDLYRKLSSKFSLSERISAGLILLNQQAKATGEKVYISAKYGFFGASLPTDKDLTDLDKSTIQALGWSCSGGGEYTIYLEE